ncbi:MAG: hypothetical protein IPI46_07925 [Bacteroidetes bacterium]|nr:hypothetical protein [Bacteroidota bacterium]
MTNINKFQLNKLMYPIKKEKFVKNKDGIVEVPDEAKAISYLNESYDFRYNEVLSRVELKKINSEEWKLIEDQDLNTFNIEIKAKGICIAKDYLRTFFDSRFVKPFHPFKNFFDSLPPWDGKTDYIQQLADSVTTTNTILWYQYLIKWLVGTCRCAIDPEYSNDYSLVLLGGQGIGKTRWIQALIPLELRTYFYSGAINFNDKDSIRRLASGFVIFIDEIDSYSRTEIPKLKALMTQPNVLYRKAYGVFENHYARTSSFVAATNNPKYLTDNTGNRRFLTVEVINANFKHQIDMNLVYAQVYALANDESFISYFNSEETELIQRENKNFQYQTELQILLEEMFAIPKQGDSTAVFMMPNQIKKYLEQEMNGENFDINLIGKTLIRLGFKRVSNGSGNSRRNGYFVKIRNPKSIEMRTAIPDEV